MSINCDVILQWDATPKQIAALGTALWGWCSRAAGATGIYQYLDNQALADMIAGNLSVPGQTPQHAGGRGVHFRFRDETSRDPRATLASLRRDIPAGGVEDVVVDGKSWNLID